MLRCLTIPVILMTAAMSPALACGSREAPEPVRPVVPPIVHDPAPDAVVVAEIDEPRESIEVDPSWVAFDRRIVTLCPNLTVRAEAAISLESPGQDEVPSEEPRWDELARCVNEGPLHGVDLEVVAYRRELEGGAELAAAVAHEMVDAGIAENRIGFDRPTEDLDPPSLDARVLIQLDPSDEIPG